MVSYPRSLMTTDNLWRRVLEHVESERILVLSRRFSRSLVFSGDQYWLWHIHYSVRSYVFDFSFFGGFKVHAWWNSSFQINQQVERNTPQGCWLFISAPGWAPLFQATHYPWTNDNRYIVIFHIYLPCKLHQGCQIPSWVLQIYPHLVLWESHNKLPRVFYYKPCLFNVQFIMGISDIESWIN